MPGMIGILRGLALPFHAAFGRSVATSLILLSLEDMLGKMPHSTVGSQGLIPRGTFREHFTFHSWQAGMAARRLLEREADSQDALHRRRS